MKALVFFVVGGLISALLIWRNISLGWWGVVPGLVAIAVGLWSKHQQTRGAREAGA
jgi:uncharacterized membrane protein